MLYSFDIFDTCITRSCGIPENVFYILASEIVEDGNKATVMGFIRDRIDAEQKAIDSLKKDSVTIEEIYQYFDTSVFTRLGKAEVMQKEIEIDLNSFVPVKETCKLLEKCRRKGRVVFISDMYHPQSVIKSKLLSLGIAHDGEEIYVSCEYNKSKFTGTLFDYVLAQEKTNKKDWHHYGDNRHNDYIVPRKKGIKAHLVNTGYSSYEKMWSTEAAITGNNALSVISGVFRSVRLQYNIGANDEFYSNIMAPLFVSIAYAVVEKAYQDGVRRLYFASRDTYLWFKIAEKYISAYDDLEIRYIHLSTKALYPAYIKDGNADDIKTILKFAEGITTKRALLLLGLETAEVDTFKEIIDLDKRLYKEKDIDAFIQQIGQSKFNSVIKDRCANKRTLVYDYLIQEGLISKDGIKTGLVDLGWNGTSQFVINDIDTNHIIKFYYYGRFHYQMPFKQIGDFYSLSYKDDIQEMDVFFKVIEYFMCKSLEGSTMGYMRNENGLIKPLLGDKLTDPSYLEKVKHAQDVVLRSAELFAQYQCTQKNAMDFFKTCAQRTLWHFTHFPSYPLVKDIADDLYYEHLSHKSRVIIRWPILKFIWKKIRRRLGYVSKEYDMTWMAASVVYTYHGFGEWINRERILSRVWGLHKN